jgi:hypothetical protein
VFAKTEALANDRVSARFHNVVARHDAGQRVPLPLVISLLVLGTLAFGLIAPNAMQGAMQPLPQIAGASICWRSGSDAPTRSAN